MNQVSSVTVGFRGIQARHRAIHRKIERIQSESQGQDPRLPRLKRMKLELKDKMEGRKNN